MVPDPVSTSKRGIIENARHTGARSDLGLFPAPPPQLPLGADINATHSARVYVDYVPRTRERFLSLLRARREKKAREGAALAATGGTGRRRRVYIGKRRTAAPRELSPCLSKLTAVAVAVFIQESERADALISGTNFLRERRGLLFSFFF